MRVSRSRLLLLKYTMLPENSDLVFEWPQIGRGVLILLGVADRGSYLVDCPNPDDRDPLLVAILFAALLHPVVDSLKRHKFQSDRFII